MRGFFSLIICIFLYFNKYKYLIYLYQYFISIKFQKILKHEINLWKYTLYSEKILTIVIFLTSEKFEKIGPRWSALTIIIQKLKQQMINCSRQTITYTSLKFLKEFFFYHNSSFLTSRRYSAFFTAVFHYKLRLILK